MKKSIATIIVLALAGIFLIAATLMAGNECPMAAKAAQASKTSAPAKPVPEGDKTIVLNVSSMTCGGCVNHITKTLSAVEGVDDVTVSLETKSASVVYNPTKVQPEALAAAVVKAGYPTEVAPAAMAGEKPGCAKSAGAKAGCDPTCPMMKGIKSAPKTEASAASATDDKAGAASDAHAKTPAPGK